MKMHSPLVIAAALLVAACVSQAQESRPAPAEGTATRRSGGERERAGAASVRLNPLFAALDTNGDGVIDAEEIANAAESLKKLDKNHDGKITPDEVQPAPRGERRASAPSAAPSTAASAAIVARLMQFDKNGDGKLSKDELPERLQAMFDKADLNKDGFLSKDEIAKLAAAQAAATAATAATAAPARPTGRNNREKEDDDDD